jgi:hypothetical protein
MLGYLMANVQLLFEKQKNSNTLCINLDVCVNIFKLIFKL